MIQKYEAFLKALELGSFTKAAESLNYTQSGVSRMIQDLEKEWNLVLFERGKGGIRLTTDGQKLAPQLQRIYNEYELLQRQIEGLHDLQYGTIRIATFSSVAVHWLPHMIKRFKQDYPQIEFELLQGDYSEIEQWIVEGRVDFGFLGGPVTHQLETIFIEEDPLYAVLPKNHPYAQAEVFPLHALAESPFMMYEKGENDLVAQVFEKHKIVPRVDFTTWDDYAIMSMIENDLGISILPKLILQRIPYNVVIKPLEEPIFRTIQIGMRDHNTLSIIAQRFLTYLPYRNVRDK